MMKRVAHESMSQKVTKMLELPEDIVLNMPKIELLGEKHLRVENFKGIIEYSDTVTRLNLGTKLLKILGANLTIQTMTNDEITMGGTIHQVEFE